MDERDIFTADPPRPSRNFAALDALMTGEAGVDRAIAHFPFLEQANPRAYDLTPDGMARTGADVVRWLAAIILRLETASAEPVHQQFGRALGLDPVLSGLVRRLLILAADHGFEQGTFAVRAVASTGVTPWRAVATGLAVATGRRSKFGQNDALRRFMAEVAEGGDPEEPVLRRLREGETLPGFDSASYANGDPRGAALLGYYGRERGDDPDYRKLRRALDLVFELKGQGPNFALASTFAESKLGLPSRRGALGLSSSEAPYLVGRATGWIAHGIEQYSAGETQHRDLLYRGRLPPPA